MAVGLTTMSTSDMYVMSPSDCCSTLIHISVLQYVHQQGCGRGEQALLKRWPLAHHETALKFRHEIPQEEDVNFYTTFFSESKIYTEY